MHYSIATSRATGDGEKTTEAWFSNIKKSINFTTRSKTDSRYLATPKIAGPLTRNYIALQGLCNKRPRDTDVEVEGQRLVGVKAESY